MKLGLSVLLFLLAFASSGQSKSVPPGDTFSDTSTEAWQKAVINICLESFKYPKYFLDSVLESGRKAHYSKQRMDSITIVYSALDYWVASAIFASYKGRDYLITVKHVLMDSIAVFEKIYENRFNPATWDTLEAVYTFIMLNIPYDIYYQKGHIDNFVIYNNNFVQGPRHYFFINDRLDEGIGIISLQARECRPMDTLLRTCGYSPISLEKVCNYGNFKRGDDIVNIGFPEGISVVGQDPIPTKGQIIPTPRDLVEQFTISGKIAQYNPVIHFFFVDLTSSPGCSGSPIIHNGKLIGIVSGSNRYRILNSANVNNADMWSLGGHFVLAISTNELCQKLDNYRWEEDKLLENEKKNPIIIPPVSSSANQLITPVR